MQLRSLIRNIIKEVLDSKHQKYIKLKSEQPILVYRGIHESGKNFYKGDKPLPFTYYSLNKEKAQYYGNVSEYIFQGKVFFGSGLFDKFGTHSNIEDKHVIDTLASEGYKAALIKGDELVVFDKNSIKPV